MTFQAQSESEDYKKIEDDNSVDNSTDQSVKLVVDNHEISFNHNKCNMDNAVIQVIGNQKITGNILIQGAKNSSLLLVACGILVKNTSELRLSNIPNITDIVNMLDLIKECSTDSYFSYASSQKTLILKASNICLDNTLHNNYCNESHLIDIHHNNHNKITDYTNIKIQQANIHIFDKISQHFMNNIIEFAQDFSGNFVICSTKASKIRTSIILLGPILAKGMGIAIQRPGGCTLNVGNRAIDMHIDALTQMGATIELKEIDGNEYIFAKPCKNRLNAINYKFRQISVTATANIIYAATLANGTTILENIAIEPEIIDLIELLTKMGAKIEFIDQRCISIIGVDELTGAYHAAIHDRIEAGTYMIAAAAIGEEVRIFINPSIVKNTTNILKTIGATIQEYDDHIVVTKNKIQPIHVKTGPYPEFSTDLQPQLTALLAIASGYSTIEETLFDNRVHHVNELNKMGAKISIEKSTLSSGTIIHIEGVNKLIGTDLHGYTLRDSAAMVIAGLIAEKSTFIHNADKLYRGYENIIQKLQSCKGNIRMMCE